MNVREITCVSGSNLYTIRDSIKTVYRVGDAEMHVPRCKRFLIYPPMEHISSALEKWGRAFEQRCPEYKLWKETSTS